jgi:hypothetical protein
MENILLDTMFDLPSMDGVDEVLIDKDVVEGRRIRSTSTPRRPRRGLKQAQCVACSTPPGCLMRTSQCPYSANCVQIRTSGDRPSADFLLSLPL